MLLSPIDSNYSSTFLSAQSKGNYSININSIPFQFKVYSNSVVPENYFWTQKFIFWLNLSYILFDKFDLLDNIEIYSLLSGNNEAVK